MVEPRISQGFTNFCQAKFEGADDTTWEISDVNELMDTIQLDQALDNLLTERHTRDRNPMKTREWSTRKHSNVSLKTRSGM